MSDIILGVILGVMISMLLIYWYIRSLIKKVLSEIDKQIEKAQETLMPVTVERVNGQIFCYAQEDNTFICQGATLTEIREAFKTRYPERTAYLAGGDEILVKELRTELKESSEISTSK